MYFQDVVLRLQQYWSQQGCALTQPYDVEKGAATFHPATFLRSLGPEPFFAAYTEPCRRPADGRYGENPIRMQHYYQFQVVVKPNPSNLMELYLNSLYAIGIKPLDHDIRFVHDDWESPTLGAWGLGWEVWIDGLEVTQFTYFQQVGGMDLFPITGEITYGLERLVMFLQNKNSVYDIDYNQRYTYGDFFLQNEKECSHYNFELANISLQQESFKVSERECLRLCNQGYSIPALDYCLKASHHFNILDARGAISVSERKGYILRVRKLAHIIAKTWLKSRESLGFPLGKVIPEIPAKHVYTEIKPTISAQSLPLLIELGVEEIPAQVVLSLHSQLPEIVRNHLGTLLLPDASINIFITPRRITIAIDKLRLNELPHKKEIKGPPLKVGKDTEGNWTKAALGFAKKNHITTSDFVIRDMGITPYIFAELEHPGRSAFAILAENIPLLFKTISWYKTMRWGKESTRFVRPIRWLLSLLGDTVIPTRIGSIEASNVTYGHRFLAPDQIPISQADAHKYIKILKGACVIVQSTERKESIQRQLKELAEKSGLLWKQDDDLLEEVTNLVEYPVGVGCCFPQKYLKMPEFILTSEMKKHQKYFPYHNREGKLDHRFAVISNTLCQDQTLVQRGYERVLQSRFADAEFFLAEDKKCSLETRVQQLSRIVFQEELGTIFDKTKRIEALSLVIASILSLSSESKAKIQKISLLCKADLTTNMVTEFPDLQGKVGGYYAELEGYSSEISEGICEHYYPVNIHGKQPSSLEAAIVGIADRMDTFVGIFAIGKVPTGSADPYGLRRSCLTSASIILHWQLPFRLSEIICKSMELYTAILPPFDPKNLQKNILDFFSQRLSGMLEEGTCPSIAEDFSRDIIRASFHASLPWDNLVDWVKRLQLLQESRNQPQMRDVLLSFRRVHNILREEKEVCSLVNQKKFCHDEECILWSKAESAKRDIEILLKNDNYPSILKKLASMKESIDAFFATVLVNDPVPEIRENRKALLQNIVIFSSHIADFSYIQHAKTPADTSTKKS